MGGKAETPVGIGGRKLDSSCGGGGGVRDSCRVHLKVKGTLQTTADSSNYMYLTVHVFTDQSKTSDIIWSTSAC